MKYFKEYIDEISPLMNDNENYIILNDGKPIRENIINEDDIEVSLDKNFDSSDYLNKPRNERENEIISKAHFNVFIKINSETTLKLFHLNDDEEYIKYSIEVARKTNVKVIDIYSRVATNAKMLTEVIVNERAKLNYVAFSRCENNVENHFNGYVDERAELTVSNLMANDNKYKLFSNIYVCEKFSKIMQRNAIVNNTKEDQEYTYNVHHLAPQSQSVMYNNAICNSDSFIVLNTDGIIPNGSIETDLNQKSKGILLDEKSNIIANPILEIDEYDCKASHGAGVGAINEQDLFYLMSRGIKRDYAIRLIINSYLEPVMREFEFDEIKDYIQNIINEKI